MMWSKRHWKNYRQTPNDQKIFFLFSTAQRSAQELPVIESVSLTSCSVEGGEELLLSGSNFLPISRVLFMERGTGKGLERIQTEWRCFSSVWSSYSQHLTCVELPINCACFLFLLYQTVNYSGRKRLMLTGTTVMR